MKANGKLLATAAGFAAPIMGMSVAGAADMPLKAAPAPAPATVSWAGWYIGGHAGAYWQHATWSVEDFIDRTHNNSGFIGGGQIGYNWQNGNAVYGIEVDGSWLSGQAKTDNFEDDKSVRNKIRWLSTARLRLGLAVGNSMAYVTGGLAIGGVKNEYVNPLRFSVANKSASKTRLGWTVGGGVEHMVTRNWSLALEALFVDLGRQTVSSLDPTKTGRFSNQAVIGRAKLNYRW